MAGKATAAAKAVRWGVRYAPVAYQAVKQVRAPAQAAVHRAYTRVGSRRQALAHAATLIDGSALRTYAGDDQVWVVFSGDQPVAAHPATEFPLATLLRHADLDKRVRPQDPHADGDHHRLPSWGAARTGPAPAPTQLLAEAPEDD